MDSIVQKAKVHKIKLPIFTTVIQEPTSNSGINRIQSSQVLKKEETLLDKKH